MRPTFSAPSTSPRHVTPRGTLASEPILTSPRPRRVSEFELADHSISPRVEQRHSVPIESEVARNPLLHHTPSPSMMSLHLRHDTSCLVFTNSASAERPDYPISPHVGRRRSASTKPEFAHDPVSKPRSRRCFVCGTTGMHPLDFRVCPRTAVLLRRSLAKIDDAGRLVLFDGSPLPMTRHPGGVAAHIISRLRTPTRFIPEPPKLSPTPIAHIPPRPVSIEPRDHVPSPTPMFNSSSPHAVPPIELITPAPDYVPHRHIHLPFDCAQPTNDDTESRVRSMWLILLLESLIDGVFRGQLRRIMSLIESLGIPDPPMLRQHLQPVFERISIPLH